jgi:hypothetical protein
MPAFAINQFRNAMIGDGARPNLFEVILTFPAPAAGGAATIKLPFTCKSAQLPGSTLGVVPVQYFGRELKFAGNRTFADWTITVINDEDFVVRNAFERWMNSINTHTTNLRNAASLPPSSYTQDGTIIQYSKIGIPIKSYKLVGAFPSDLSPIDVDWGSNDTMEEFTVTLAYQWWEDIPIAGLSTTPPA